MKTPRIAAVVLCLFFVILSAGARAGDERFYYGAKGHEAELVVPAKEVQAATKALSPNSAVAFLEAKTGVRHKPPFRLVEEPDIYECSDTPKHRFRVPTDQAGMTQIIRAAAAAKK